MPTHNGEDKALERLLGNVSPGFYMDVGANDPLTSSNGHPFYMRGWRGIDVEPIPHLAAKLRAIHPGNRVFQCAAGAENGRVNLLVPENLELSTVSRGIAEIHIANGFGQFTPLDVETRTLDSILAECCVDGPIAFVSIDVEGAEGAVLAGFDLTKYRPQVLLLEATVPNTRVPCWDGWEYLVLDRGYRLALFDGYNRFYTRLEAP
jgi:FkbM family methyltransferase